MTNYQFNLILALLFIIAANGVDENGAAAIGYVIGTICGAIALVSCFLERKS